MTRLARASLQIVLAITVLAVFSIGGCGWVQVPGSRTGPTGASQTTPNPAVASARVTPRPPAAARKTARSIRAVPGGKAVQAVPGDTVYALSRRHGVPVDEIIETNDLQPPYHLVVGQWVTLKFTDANAQPDEIVESSTLPPVADSPSPKPVVARTPAPSPAIPPPPAARSGGFMWPVDGKIVSSFGRKTKGLHNDGINIEVARGTPVRASQSGVVAYAGNELRGFGNMLLIKHSGGWVTAYAHNETLKVGRGDKVSRGQVIAEVGTSGSVTKPQLHFELRKGKKPVDPLRYLGKGAI